MNIKEALSHLGLSLDTNHEAFSKAHHTAPKAAAEDRHRHRAVEVLRTIFLDISSHTCALLEQQLTHDERAQFLAAQTEKYHQALAEVLPHGTTLGLQKNLSDLGVTVPHSVEGLMGSLKNGAVSVVTAVSSGVERWVPGVTWLTGSANQLLSWAGLIDNNHTLKMSDTTPTPPPTAATLDAKTTMPTPPTDAIDTLLASLDEPTAAATKNELQTTSEESLAVAPHSTEHHAEGKHAHEALPPVFTALKGNVSDAHAIADKFGLMSTTLIHKHDMRHVVDELHHRQHAVKMSEALSDIKAIGQSKVEHHDKMVEVIKELSAVHTVSP